MTRALATIIAVFLAVAPAWGASNLLQWKDNSGNETGFNIERKQTTCADTTGTWVEISVVGANVSQFTDNSVQEGASYCYRVAASNSAGKSAFSNTAGDTIPFSVPAAPSSLTVVPGP